MRPNIGISLRITNAKDYDEKRDSLSHDWPIFLEKIQAIPIWIPNIISNLPQFLQELDLDGIILSGIKIEIRSAHFTAFSINKTSKLSF